MICDKLLQNLGDKSKIKPRLRFWCIIREHSVQSNPDSKKDKWDKISLNNSFWIFFFLQILRLVLNVTYLTGLDIFRYHKQSKASDTKPKVNIWKILQKFMPSLGLKEHINTTVSYWLNVTCWKIIILDPWTMISLPLPIMDWCICFSIWNWH